MTGDELKALRKAAGYSRPTLAAMCGLHADSIKYWERKPIVDLCGHAVRRILEVLGPVKISRGETGENVRSARARRAFLPNGEFFATNTRARGGVLDNSGFSRGRRGQSTCGAKTRKGTPCRARALPGKKRCKFHGGMSTGPKTAEGRERIAEAQRRRWASFKRSRNL